MRKLLYYPGFEFKDSDWLKFALLYIEELRPIIPSSGFTSLSPFFRMIQEETDLIKTYQPNFSEANPASIAAMRNIEDVLRKPSNYFYTFGTRNVVDRWKITGVQDYVLYREKYSQEFEQFCLEENLIVAMREL